MRPPFRRSARSSHVMQCRVLGIARDALISKGYHVLRYNSRGVGLSSGWASFTGFSEAQDLKDIVQWALRYLGSVDKLVIFVGHLL